MDLNKDTIQRYDFAEIRGGYDRQEVDNHLRYIASVVDKLTRQARESQTASGAAATRIEALLEAAEREATARKQEAEQAASDMKESANRKAEMTLRSANSGAYEKQQQLEASVTDRLQRTHSASLKAHQQAASGERTLSKLADGLPRTSEVVNELSGRAENFRAALDATQTAAARLREQLAAESPKA